jgi:hypothetical protein
VGGVADGVIRNTVDGTAAGKVPDSSGNVNAEGGISFFLTVKMGEKNHKVLSLRYL